jgi:hypothetical protein
MSAGSKSTLLDTIGQFTTIPNSVIKMWAEIGEDAFQFFVYLRYRSGTNDECWPSYDTITQDTGMNRNRIAAAIKTLEEHKLMTRKRRFSGSTIYSLHLPTPPTSSTNIILMDETSSVVRNQDCISTNPVLPLVRNQDSNKTQLTKPIQQESIDTSDKLNTPEFMAAWKEWLSYRQESKHKLTERTAVKQLEMLESYEPMIAVAMLNQSILNGWTGIFELKKNGNGKVTQPEKPHEWAAEW